MLWPKRVHLGDLKREAKNKMEKKLENLPLIPQDRSTVTTTICTKGLLFISKRHASQNHPIFIIQHPEAHSSTTTTTPPQQQRHNRRRRRLDVRLYDGGLNMETICCVVVVEEVVE